MLLTHCPLVLAYINHFKRSRSFEHHLKTKNLI